MNEIQYHRKALRAQDIMEVAAILDKYEVPTERRAGLFMSQDIKRLLNTSNITHYNKSIDARLKIAERIGYCCMINNLHVYIL